MINSEKLKLVYDLFMIKDVIIDIYDHYQYRQNTNFKDLNIEKINKQNLEKMNNLDFKQKIQYLSSCNILQKFSGAYSEGVILLDNYVIIKILRKNQNGMIFFKNEVNTLLTVINENHFPKLICADINSMNICMTYCGELISKENLPNNWYEQFIEIKEILLKYELIIADIQYKNICVLNNIIYLIDFGFSHKGSILEVERDIKILYKRLNDLHINDLHNYG